MDGKCSWAAEWCQLVFWSASNQTWTVSTECQSIKMNEWTHFCHQSTAHLTSCLRILKGGPRITVHQSFKLCYIIEHSNRNGIGNFFYRSIDSVNSQGIGKNISNKYLSKHFLPFAHSINNLGFLLLLSTDLTWLIQKKIGNQHEIHQKMTTNAYKLVFSMVNNEIEECQWLISIVLK